MVRKEGAGLAGVELATGSCTVATGAGLVTVRQPEIHKRHDKRIVGEILIFIQATLAATISVKYNEL